MVEEGVPLSESNRSLLIVTPPKELLTAGDEITDPHDLAGLGILPGRMVPVMRAPGAHEPSS